MDDFEATVIAQDAIRLDFYNDEIDGPTKGRFTENISVCQAMGIVILLCQAIEKCEVTTAKSKPKGKRK